MADEVCLTFYHVALTSCPSPTVTAYIGLSEPITGADGAVWRRLEWVSVWPEPFAYDASHPEPVPMPGTWQPELGCNVLVGSQDSIRAEAVVMGEMVRVAVYLRRPQPPSSPSDRASTHGVS